MILMTKRSNGNIAPRDPLTVATWARNGENYEDVVCGFLVATLGERNSLGQIESSLRCLCI